jgi:uncharacterized protein
LPGAYRRNKKSIGYCCHSDYHDLVIDRRDRVINLCEMKFSIHPFTITKGYAQELSEKIRVFKEQTKTTKAIYLTMITTFGLAPNAYASSMVKNSFDMDIFFG